MGKNTLDRSFLKSTIIIILLTITIFQVNGSKSQSSPVQHEIHIQNNRFLPSEITINIGDTVKFIWDAGAFGHNVAQAKSDRSTEYDGDGFRTSVQNGPSEWELPSEYTQNNVTLFFICEPHVLSDGMRGKIIVGSGSEIMQEEGFNRTLFWGITFVVLVVLGGAFVYIMNKNS